MKRLFTGGSHAKPLRKQHLSVEIPAETASQFIKADKFEKSEQGGSRECNLRYAAAAIQGFRPHMQDDYVCKPCETLKGETYSFFGVFDGHGELGGIVSQYCSDHLLKSILDRKAIRTAKHLSKDLLVGSIEKTFVKFDQELEETQRKGPTKTDLSYSGTTATTVLISTDQIYIGNVGDSRTILCRDGDVTFSSEDHTPAVESEEERITAAGGKVHTTPARHKIILDAEAYSNLAVSRTLGDFGFKIPPTLPVEKRVVSPVPDVTVFSRDFKRDQFMILASDGVFKSMNNEEVVKFVLRQMEVTEDLSSICRNLIHMAYFAANNIPDDTTVILITFPAAPTLSEETIQEEAKIAVEAKEAIDALIKEIVDKAESVWVVQNEFNILQRLVKDLPSKYQIQQRVPYVMETLKRLREERYPELAVAATTNGTASPGLSSQPEESEDWHSQVTEYDDNVFHCDTDGVADEETQVHTEKMDRLPSIDEHKVLKQDCRDSSNEPPDACESSGVNCESADVNQDQVSGDRESKLTGMKNDPLTVSESTDVNSDQVTESTGVNSDHLSESTGVISDTKVPVESSDAKGDTSHHDVEQCGSTL